MSVAQYAFFVIAAAIAIAATACVIAERLRIRATRRANLAYFAAYSDGREAERRAAGLEANKGARWVG
jgi:hypothetical protein